MTSKLVIHQILETDSTEWECSL